MISTFLLKKIWMPKMNKFYLEYFQKKLDKISEDMKKLVPGSSKWITLYGYKQEIIRAADETCGLKNLNY